MNADCLSLVLCVRVEALRASTRTHKTSDEEKESPFSSALRGDNRSLTD